MIPVFSARHVEAAVSPDRAVEAVRDAFVAYARGEWSMPPKVYVPAYPAGDFRAMPALGAGHASLKWVTSFPANPAQGLPTVTGLVLLSDASNGMLRAALDAGAVTALRTGAAAVLAAEALGRADAQTAAVIGAGVNGRAAARTFAARGRDVIFWDVDANRARSASENVRGARAAESRAEAFAADLLVTVTPGHEILLPEGSLRAGQHVSLMGADGPGKAEIAVGELTRVRLSDDDSEQSDQSRTPDSEARVRLSADDWEESDQPGILDPEARVRLFADDWEQASHNGDLADAVGTGAITQNDVTQLGDVLADTVPGRQSPDDITIFDSTGLAIQDLAIALAAMERADELDLPVLEL
jgi:alanine dehydrogenase